jgi:hypothetical protein
MTNDPKGSSFLKIWGSPLLFTDFENDLILLKRFLKRLLTPFELPTPTLSPVRIRPDIDLNLMHLQQGLPESLRRLPMDWMTNAFNQNSDHVQPWKNYLNIQFLGFERDDRIQILTGTDVSVYPVAIPLEWKATMEQNTSRQKELQLHPPH